MRRNYILAAAVAIWLVIIGGGMTTMWMYSFRAGEAGKTPAVWPEASRLHHSQALPTLVMVVHPRCSCSRASIGELATLMTQSADGFRAYVIFVQPPKVAADWAQTDLWNSVSSIRGVSRVLDDGTEARLFGAATSGQTMVYDKRGHLLFSGGITASRGHLGENSGLTSIIALTSESKPTAKDRTPVYGCPLFSVKSKQETRPETCRR
jgi:hypothetical protein